MKYFISPRGFTLIELLVVIAIIGVLSSTVLASLQSTRVEARNAQRISEARELMKALELYRNNFGGYPCAGNSTALDEVGNNLACLSVDNTGNDPINVRITTTGMHVNFRRFVGFAPNLDTQISNSITYAVGVAGSSGIPSRTAVRSGYVLRLILENADGTPTAGCVIRVGNPAFINPNWISSVPPLPNCQEITGL